MAESSFGLRRAAFKARRVASDVALPTAVVVIAAAYFLWAALLATRVIAIPGLEPTVTVDDWMVFGAALMAVLLLILVVDHARKRSALAHEAAYGNVPAPAVAPPKALDELVVTAESWEGLRVLEYSRPPKSDHRAAVYAKCHIPLDGTYVLRVEDLVAEERR